jgi:hypothetical protein
VAGSYVNSAEELKIMSADAQALIRTAVYAVLAPRIYVSVCADVASRAIRRFASYMTSVNAAVEWSLTGPCVVL